MQNADKEDIIIFGASGGGSTAYELLNQDYNIKGFSDNDAKKWDKLYLGKPVIKPDTLLEMKNIIIIIASEYYFAINRQLREMGLSNIKVFVDRSMDKNQSCKDAYVLCEIPKEHLFETCSIDWEKVNKIKNDFSKNYYVNNRKSITERVLPKDNRLKKVLFCSYLFPPIGGAGIQRSLKFVKYLRRYGYDPVVLTVDPNSYFGNKDKTMLDEIEDDISIIQVNGDVSLCEAIPKNEQQEIINLYAGIFESQDVTESYMKAAGQLTFPLLPPDKSMCWVNRCLSCIEDKLDLSKIDLIYTTGNPFATYILGYYIKNKYNIPWIQDYRDSWCTNKYYIENLYTSKWRQTLVWQEKLEEGLVKRSDAIVTIGDEADEYVEKYGVDKSKFFDIKNGYDEDDFKNIHILDKKNQKFTLCHNGEIYIGRNPIYLMRIINDIIDNGKIDKDTIQWIFNGDIEQRYKELLDKEDKYKIIKYNGYLKHGKSIETAMNSDVLVLFGEQGEGAKVVYTGKVFEYLRMKKPILCFSSEGVLNELLSETRTGEVFEYDDYSGAEKYLVHLYEKWKLGEVGTDPDEYEIEKYSRENETKQLAQIFDNLLI